MKKLFTVCVVAALAICVFTQEANAQRVRVNVGGFGFNNRGFNNRAVFVNRGFNNFGFNNRNRVVFVNRGFNNFGFNNRVRFVQPRFIQPSVFVNPGFQSFGYSQPQFVNSGFGFSSFADPCSVPVNNFGYSSFSSCSSGFSQPLFIPQQRIIVRGGGFCH